MAGSSIRATVLNVPATHRPSRFQAVPLLSSAKVFSSANHTVAVWKNYPDGGNEGLSVFGVVLIVTACQHLLFRLQPAFVSLTVNRPGNPRCTALKTTPGSAQENCRSGVESRNPRRPMRPVRTATQGNRVGQPGLSWAHTSRASLRASADGSMWPRMLAGGRSDPDPGSGDQ